VALPLLMLFAHAITRHEEFMKQQTLWREFTPERGHDVRYAVSDVARYYALCLRLQPLYKPRDHTALLRSMIGVSAIYVTHQAQRRETDECPFTICLLPSHECDAALTFVSRLMVPCVQMRNVNYVVGAMPRSRPRRLYYLRMMQRAQEC